MSLLPPVPRPELLTLVGSVFAFMAICTSLTFTVPALRRPDAARIRGAINGWWPPALAGAAMVFGGELIATLAVTGIASAALHEFLAINPSSERRAGTDLLARVLTALLPACLVLFGPLAASVLFLVGAIAVLPVVALIAHGPAGFTAAVTRAQFGVALCGLSLAHVLLPYWSEPTSASGAALAPSVLAVLLVSVMANDASQYLVGKFAGRHRLAPITSPNKTWEGFLGGLVVTVLLGAAMAESVVPWNRALGAGLGAAVSALGLLGDLLISALKRDVGVKDTGTSLGAHGGILDRADSLLLAGPAFGYGALTILVLGIS